jgi:hypothetical protein
MPVELVQDRNPFRLSAVKQEPTETPSDVAGISGLLQAGEEVKYSARPGWRDSRQAWAPTRT